MSKPGYRHYRAAIFLLSYLSGTIDLGIAVEIVGFTLVLIQILVQTNLEERVLVLYLY